MQWFGEPWGAPACDPQTRIDTPVGQLCGWCDEAIVEHDQGVRMLAAARPPYDLYYHLNCYLRQVVGSLAHQNGTCSCAGGDDDDPPGMTLRQAADAAVAAFYNNTYARGV